MRAENREVPIWKLVVAAAQELTEAGRIPFARKDLIDIVQRSRPNCDSSSINPIIQGLTDNLRGGAPSAVGPEILHSVGRGQFILKKDARSTYRLKEKAIAARPARASDGAFPTNKGTPKLRLGGHDFYRVCQIDPYRTNEGSVKEFRPQAAYRNDAQLPLNTYGSGAFCRFRIPNNISLSGVYAIRVDSELRYIGECSNLSQRYNMGYGLISPRNCFKHGQETNCRINKLLLQAAKASSEIELWFLPTEHYKAVEKELLQALKPPWNRR